MDLTFAANLLFSKSGIILPFQLATGITATNFGWLTLGSAIEAQMDFPAEAEAAKLVVVIDRGATPSSNDALTIEGVYDEGGPNEDQVLVATLARDQLVVIYPVGLTSRFMTFANDGAGVVELIYFS